MIDPNKPAFPVAVTPQNVQFGIPIRAYLAAKAMAQLIAHKERLMADNPDRFDGADTEAAVARAAVLQADALIAELNKEGK